MDRRELADSVVDMFGYALQAMQHVEAMHSSLERIEFYMKVRSYQANSSFTPSVIPDGWYVLRNGVRFT